MSDINAHLEALNTELFETFDIAKLEAVMDSLIEIRNLVDEAEEMASAVHHSKMLAETGYVVTGVGEGEHLAIHVHIRDLGDGSLLVLTPPIARDFAMFLGTVNSRVPPEGVLVFGTSGDPKLLFTERSSGGISLANGANRTHIDAEDAASIADEIRRMLTHLSDTGRF